MALINNSTFSSLVFPPNPKWSAILAYLHAAFGYLYWANAACLVGASTELNLITSVITNELAIPCGKWWNAPNLWAIEWLIPKNALENAIPAIHEAWAIFSLALILVVPSL